MTFSSVLNAIETAYSYLYARGYSRYSVDFDAYTLTVSKEAICLKENGEEIFVLNRGYYQLSTIIEMVILADGKESYGKTSNS